MLGGASDLTTVPCKTEPFPGLRKLHRQGRPWHASSKRDLELGKALRFQSAAEGSTLARQCDMSRRLQAKACNSIMASLDRNGRAMACMRLRCDGTTRLVLRW